VKGGFERRFLGFIAGPVARLYLRTLRFTLVTHPDLEQGPASQAPWVLTFWHGHQFTLHRWTKRRRTAVLVSLSNDGEIQTGALTRLGFAVERGSSSRGGIMGLKGIVRRMREGCDAAFAVDGPRGPRGVVRAEDERVGAILAARLSRAVVVPLASACASSWVLSRTWDQFEIPRPFSRIAVALGAPLDPNELDGKALAHAIDFATLTARRALEPPVKRANAIDS